MGGFSLLLHCSHLISIGRWLADMSLRLACLLIGGRRRRGRSRIGLFGSERWHMLKVNSYCRCCVLKLPILILLKASLKLLHSPRLFADGSCSLLLLDSSPHPSCPR